MKNLIYQYWNGTIPQGSIASQNNIKQYAERIGVDYRFDYNEHYTKPLSKYSQYYDAFRPILDESFHEYDNVLFLDMDIFTIDGLKDNVFEQPNNGIAICEEMHQPELRTKSTVGTGINSKNDEVWSKILYDSWGTILPRNKQGKLKVYNSGVVLYNNNALKIAKEQFINFNEYIQTMEKGKLNKFYCLDQNYLHAMLFTVNVGFTELDTSWNTQIHYVGEPKTIPRPVNDMRTEHTKLVHIQLRGADNFNEETLWKIVNKTQDEWNI